MVRVVNLCCSGAGQKRESRLNDFPLIILHFFGLLKTAVFRFFNHLLVGGDVDFHTTVLCLSSLG